MPDAFKNQLLVLTYLKMEKPRGIPILNFQLPTWVKFKYPVTQKKLFCVTSRKPLSLKL